MRRALFFLNLIVAMGLMSQNPAGDTAREFNIYKYKSNPKDRLILEFNHTGWVGVGSGLQEKPFSGGVNLMLFFDHPIGKSYFSFAWGVGLSSFNIHGMIKLVDSLNPVNGQVIYTSISQRTEPYNINRIGLKVLEVPVEFRFRSHTNYQFKASLGFKVGYVVQSFQKIFDAHEKAKIYDIPGLNPWRYGPSFRIGVEQLHFTAFYSLSEFFLSGKGTAGVHPFYIGIAYTPRISLGRK